MCEQANVSCVNKSHVYLTEGQHIMQFTGRHTTNCKQSRKSLA